MDSGIYIEDAKYAKKDLGRVCILGLGVSGKAVCEYLIPKIGKRVSSISVIYGDADEATVQWIEDVIADHGCEGSVHAERDLTDSQDHFDLCIASPGISEFSDLYLFAKNSSDETISEVEFAWRESDGSSRWIAITGTNGKTTTTALTEYILQCAGLDACAVGNIGQPCIEAISYHHAIYAVETSSYQLASTADFAPNVAIILGITPDHLSWHRSHANYVDAKYKILENLNKVDGIAVLDATNDEVRSKIREIKNLASEAPYPYIPIGTAKGIDHDMREACGSMNSAYVGCDGMLTLSVDGADHPFCNISELKLKGPHNHVNALAACAAAFEMGVADSDIGNALREFKPLEHRIEFVDSVAGVDYYNDSKATNVDATLVALKAFLPIKPIVLLGGRDKGTSLDELVSSCRANVKAAICFGEAKERFYEALQNADMAEVEVHEIDDFDSAFRLANDIAEAGDIVLLSPACASFDEFSCFEERGEHFKSLVHALNER